MTLKQLIGTIKGCAKYLMSPYYIQKWQLPFYRFREPVRPYAYIRLYNEIVTVDACLKSLLTLLKGGVIGLHQCSDGTKEYVQAFCQQHPQFKAIDYPHDIQFYVTDDEPEDVRYFYDYCNEIWSYLPKNEWVIKVDGDHVFDTAILGDVLRVPRKKSDIVYLARIDIHVEDGEVFVRDGRQPIVEMFDHWLLFNDASLPEAPFERYLSPDGTKVHETYSKKIFENKTILYAPVTNWHFLWARHWSSSWRDTIDYSLWKPLRDSRLRHLSSLERGRFFGRVHKRLLDEQTILTTYGSLNHERKRLLPQTKQEPNVLT